MRGDILSLISANDTGARRLIDMMTEFKLTSLDALAKHILNQSEKGARDAIKALPEGEWSYEMPLDGYERELALKSKIIIKGGKITVDFSAPRPPRSSASTAPHLYPCLCGLRPQGGDRTPCAEQHRLALLLRLVTEPGTMVDPIRPSPVTARQSSARCWRTACSVASPGAARHGAGGKCRPHLDPVALLRPWTGSAGGNRQCEELRGHQHRSWRHRGQARQGWTCHHGLPVRRRHHSHRGDRNPVPALFQAEALSADWGGAGRWRGGVSQVIEMASREDAPFSISAATFDRIHHPAQGREAACGVQGLGWARFGRHASGQGHPYHCTGDSLVLELPGGGGFGTGRQARSRGTRGRYRRRAGEPRGGAARLRLRGVRVTALDWRHPGEGRDPALRDLGVPHHSWHPGLRRGDAWCGSWKAVRPQSGFSPASISARRLEEGRQRRRLAELSSGSSAAKPGPSVAISNRMPFGSRK